MYLLFLFFSYLFTNTYGSLTFLSSLTCSIFVVILFGGTGLGATARIEQFRGGIRNKRSGNFDGEKMQKLPYFVAGQVIKGFGRGSKQLGIPTANFPPEVVNGLPDELDTGIYYGWAAVNKGTIYKMVMSVGWNPFYKNKQKSMETHVMHSFEDDFYGSDLNVCIVGYIRPEKNFESLDELIAAIKGDIAEAERLLEKPDFQQYKTNAFFSQNQS